MANMQKPSGTGSAQIVRQGQTANRNYGANPQAKGKGITPPRDLKPKG